MYVQPRDSIAFRTNYNIDEELLRISNKYIADNPANDFVFRMYDGNNPYYQKEYGYDFNFKEMFPDAECGDWCYICAKTIREEDIDLNINVSCYGPLELYCNGELIFTPSLHAAVDVSLASLVELKLHKGENTLFVKALAAKNGFGCRIAPENNAWGWIQWLSPFGDFGGFAYTAPVKEDVIGDEIPVVDDETRDDFAFLWLPSVSDVSGDCDFSAMFSPDQKGLLYGWSSIVVDNQEGENVTFSFDCEDDVALFVDGNDVPVGSDKSANIVLAYGKHDVVVVYDYKTSIKFGVSASNEFVVPYPVMGIKGNWLYTGPLAEKVDLSENKLHRLFTDVNGEGCYWRADYSNGYIRPCLESEHFGKWTYPIGVAMYGLISVARALGRDDIAKYVKQHISLCSKLYHYSKWDEKRFGHPEINNEIVRLELLDDCGSFGSSMLETFLGEAGDDVTSLADEIADYVYRRCPKRPDGALYRVRKNHYVDNTLWADDLYMSIPFLCRYYRLTGDEKYIELAAEQFSLFKKYLFLPEYNIMSHVYDFKYETYNGIPWGRGNGWVLFSLSELILTVPENFAKRDELISFYRTLASGYLALQGKNGLWHQVLTEDDAYEETSCTSMFVYAYSRGLTNGWFLKEDEDKYFKAACNGWKGITERAVDQFGNVSGVCRGSGYSFLLNYYKNELTPNYNDIHGIGIVLLAGVALKNLLDKNIK